LKVVDRELDFGLLEAAGGRNRHASVISQKKELARRSAGKFFFLYSGIMDCITKGLAVEGLLWYIIRLFKTRI